MDHAVGVEKHVVGLDVPVHDALLVYVPHCAAELGYPEAHRFFCEGLSRDVEPKITTVHQIDHDVPATVSHAGA